MIYTMKLKIPDTLRILAPLWVEKLETIETWDEIYTTCIVKGKELNISNYTCCIVGEALNLDSDNGYIVDKTMEEFHRDCSLCYTHSRLIFNSIIYFDVAVVQVESGLNDFVNHIEKDHPEYIEEAKKRNSL